MRYYNLKSSLKEKPNLIPVNMPLTVQHSKEYYRSIYEYNEEMKAIVDSTHSAANVSEVDTNRVVFDFDNEKQPIKAKEDAITLVYRLLDQGIEQNGINSYYSGNKGFHIEFFLKDRISPKQLLHYANNTAKGLATFDASVYDYTRMFRIENTKNLATGLYKIPLTLGELQNYTMDQIKMLASVPRVDMAAVNVPQTIVVPKVVQSKVVGKELNVEANRRPKWLTNCKYSLQNGIFKEGMRSRALHCLAATYKGQGFSYDHVRSMLLTTIELSVGNGSDPFDEDELDRTILSHVFSSSHQGGTYTCKEPGWLKNYCDELGDLSCRHDNDSTTVRVAGIHDLFTDYVKDLDKNLIGTGLATLDKKVKFFVGTSSFIVGAPGSGKTNLVFQILEHNNSNINSLFFSFDMYHSQVYLRLAQRLTGFSQSKIFDIYKNNPTEKERIRALIEKTFDKTTFCFKSGQTLDDFERTIVETEQNLGEKIKLVIVDYNELLVSHSSDATASSAEVAQRLRQIANERSCAIITLVQPSKLYAKPEKEVMSYSSGKGSSAIAQSATVMLGICRPGFNPMFPENDKYFNITVVKNRNGALSSSDFMWNGERGIISELIDPEERANLKYVREMRDQKTEEQW